MLLMRSASAVSHFFGQSSALDCRERLTSTSGSGLTGVKTRIIRDNGHSTRETLRGYRRIAAPVPIPAHQTGRARFGHPASRLVSFQGRRKRPHVDVAKPENSQFAEDQIIRKANGASRLHLVASSQKMSHTFKHVVVNRSIRHQPGAIAEIS